ncbi:unnamed protein product [Urochloa decumbens]|uniref:Alpha/beta hydrolase fold-3 domain-containing protein n=1 Tax=Urochloa decumbens TaxID=240449 RepID=A0ABC9FV84_9POAL
MSDIGGGGDEVLLDAPGFIRVYKSGRVERFLQVDFAPPSTDAATGVASKDVPILPESGVSARIYLPAPPSSGSYGGKLPVLVYFHGGGFCLGSAFDAAVHGHAKRLAAAAGAIVVSVEYRLAPERPVPALYGDAWAALRWVAAHATGGQGTEPWLAEHADLGRVHVGGESAGANIAHHAAMRAGAEELGHGVKLGALVLIHPYFLGGDSSETDEMGAALLRELVRLWPVVCPGTSGCDDDPLINPMAERAPNLARLGCQRVLVCVGGTDPMRGRGGLYCEKLKGSGWCGEVEDWEADGQGHGFHLSCPTSAEAEAQVRVIAEFLSHG